MEHFGRNAMRPNPLKPRLAAGGCAFGTMTFEFFTPGYPTICREAGAEFILYDMEHSGVGFDKELQAIRFREPYLTDGVQRFGEEQGLRRTIGRFRQSVIQNSNLKEL
jgi:hypothetical protein